jgi:hypothetical protein
MSAKDQKVSKIVDEVSSFLGKHKQASVSYTAEDPAKAPAPKTAVDAEHKDEHGEAVTPENKKNHDKDAPAPSAENEEEKQGAELLNKQAARILETTRKFVEKQKSASAASPEKKEEKPAAEKQKQAANNSPEADAEEDGDSVFYMVKVAKLVLDSEEGIDLLERLAAEKQAEESAEHIIKSAARELDYLDEVGAEQERAQDSQQAEIDAFLQDPNVPEKHKRAFIRGAQVHELGQAKLREEVIEAFKQSPKVKSASTRKEKESVADECDNIVALASFNYEQGAFLAKKAAAMAEEGMDPAAIEAELMQLASQITGEELEMILAELVQEGVLPPEQAEALFQQLLPQTTDGGGGGEGGEMSPEEAEMLAELEAAEQMNQGGAPVYG